MPVEALAKEEAERLTREMVGRLLGDSGLSKRLSDLEVSLNGPRSYYRSTSMTDRSIDCIQA